jgi:hypothetical protein
MMKKIISLCVISALLIGVVYAENNVDATTANNLSIGSNGELDLVSSHDEAVVISPKMKIISKVQHQSDPKFYYAIDVNYPQIHGEDLSAGAKDFNKAIEHVVTDEITQFKRHVALDLVHMKTLPEEMRKNSLKVDYDIDVVKPKNSTLISVRMTFEGMQAGRPHPYHNNRVINFDLTTGKMITLNELFKKNAKFLQLLAAYTNKALNQKLKSDNWMVAEGTKADVKNFKNWNLQSDSILITFDEYQVAPYVYGSQEVEVPYAELKKIIDASAPIAECAMDSKSCQMG